MEKRFTEENLIVLLVLMVSTGGLYAFVWIARVSREFGDDAVTNVILSIMSGGACLLFLYLRYMDKAERLNGRAMQWYYALLIFFSFGMAAPAMIQFNLNEFETSHAPAPVPQAAPAPIPESV